jgi:hypothetical protein
LVEVVEEYWKAGKSRSVVHYQRNWGVEGGDDGQELEAEW